MYLNTSGDNLTEKLFIYETFNLETEHIFGIVSVDKAEVLRNGLIEDNLTESGFDDLRHLFTLIFLGHSYLDSGVKIDNA